MREIKDYMVLKIYGVNSLMFQVEINEGWQPFGSPFMDNNGKKKSQAMVKYKED